MGETFLININFSRILNESEATVYTMFIDSSKMSIVYELVEWIRWMFSLENCFYLTHENSVIHELEDIQVLSRLKCFEVIPCRHPHCVHKRGYRTLLENLNLIVSWNEMKVHKYFLEKINQMSQKLLQESPKSYHHNVEAESHDYPKSYNTTNSCQINLDKSKSCSNISQHLESNSSDVFDNKKTSVMDSCSKCTVTGDSPTKTNSLYNKQIDNSSLQFSSNSNHFNECYSAANETLNFKKQDNSNLKKNNVSSEEMIKTDSIFDQKNVIKQPKPVKKRPRPFSLGEILTNIREDFEKQNLDVTPKENISQNNSLVNAQSPDKNVIPCESYLVMPDKDSGTKRQRTRKRKRQKKQNSEDDTSSPHSLDKKRLYSSNIPQSNTQIKPNHIRFDVDVDDYALDSEFVTSNQNEAEEYNEEITNTSATKFPKNTAEELIPCVNGNNQDLPHKSLQNSLQNNSTNKTDSSPVAHNQTLEEEKVTQSQNEASDVANQSVDSTENFELNHFNQDLSDLWSWKEKFKKGVVVQRFY